MKKLILSQFHVRSFRYKFGLHYLSQRVENLFVCLRLCWVWVCARFSLVLGPGFSPAAPELGPQQPQRAGLAALTWGTWGPPRAGSKSTLPALASGCSTAGPPWRSLSKTCLLFSRLSENPVQGYNSGSHAVLQV